MTNENQERQPQVIVHPPEPYDVALHVTDQEIRDLCELISMGIDEAKMQLFLGPGENSHIEEHCYKPADIKRMNQLYMKLSKIRHSRQLHNGGHFKIP